MEQEYWESPDVIFLVNHLEVLPLISLYVSVRAHTHTPQTRVPNDDLITNGHIWWKEFSIGISKHYHFHSRGLVTFCPWFFILKSA